LQYLRRPEGASNATAFRWLRRRIRVGRKIQYLLSRHRECRQFSDRLRRFIAARAQAPGHRPGKNHLSLTVLEARLADIGPKRLILTHMSEDMLGRAVPFETASDELTVEI
jgi:phosphoribosyl 1,2-cyclic phosphodiesterase